MRQVRCFNADPNAAKRRMGDKQFKKKLSRFFTDFDKIIADFGEGIKRYERIERGNRRRKARAKK